MAVTKIWAIKSKLNDSLSYIKNKAKTENEDASNLLHALTYLNHDTKIENKKLVTGINCDPATAIESMIMTKQRWGKEDSIQAFHAVQSFAPGESNPSQAHQIAIELAKKLWGNRFEVVVATHLDKSHLHSHFIINSVSYIDGMRYYDKKETYRLLQKESDTLCEKYGLNIIEEPKGHGQQYDSYVKEPSKIRLITEDVEIALNEAKTMPSFIKNLKELGYEVKQGKHIAIKPTWSEKYFRLYKLKGDKYSDENIAERLYNNNVVTMSTFAYAKYPKEEAKKLKGFKALYFKYKYMLGILPKNAPKQRVHSYLKEELLHIDDISKQAIFIEQNNLETIDDINKLRENLTKQLTDNINERKRDYGSVKRCRNEDLKSLLKQDIATSSTEITSIRQQLRLLEQIEKRSTKMEEIINRIEQEEVKKENSKTRQERNEK